MPKIWSDTIDAHRHSVREAVLDTTWRLVTEEGLLSVTMTRIAQATGVGRATLYKYFPDVEAILAAWHERHAAAHLEHLRRLATSEGDAGTRLRVVLDAFALMAHHRGAHGVELAQVLHRGPQFTRAQRHLLDLLAGLLADAAAGGHVRADIPPRELARYCVHALAAAGELTSKAAVHRLAGLTMDGLRPSRQAPTASRRAR